MTSRTNRPIELVLTIQPDHPALLQGLEAWMNLGLISEDQVKRLCQQYLVCRLPVVVQPSTDFVTDFVTEPVPPQPITTTTRTRTPSRYGGVLQSFMAEVSVLWLLFLGVFMVVVSSAVLAATQWRNFSPVGQYGILFAYTLIFWGLSAWGKEQPNLRLTPQMLQVTTLLIIPVNFWMMDGFKLWESLFGWGVATLASLMLTGILINLIRPHISTSQNPYLTLANTIGLCWLHWGWSFPGFPLIATYIGTIGTALVLYLSPPMERGETSVSPSVPRVWSSFSLSAIAITFATLLLVGRAILRAFVPISQLGLALGICGWLLCWLSRRNRGLEIWSQFGWVLILAGWLVSVQTIPQQAIAVSGLALWLLGERLLRLGKTANLLALFLVGLQSFWLLWRIIPLVWQQEVIAFAISLAGNQFMPQALIGLGLFPDVILTVCLAAYLRRQEQAKLANQAEGMALILGIFLALLSSFNPLVRLINLLLSFLTLTVVVINRTQSEIGLIYLTHIAGLSTIAAAIRFALPGLTVGEWIGILLAGAIAEWIFSVGTEWRQWRRSAWHLGLVLATISYTQLFNPFLNNADDWHLAWLITPIALTLLSYTPNFPEPKRAAWLSVLALLLLQPFTLNQATPRLIIWGTATVLMLLNTQRVKDIIAAVVTVGFGLSFISAVVWELFSQRMTFAWWVVVLASASFLLWLIYSWLKNGSTRLYKVYTQATDGWAIALTLPTLTILTGYNITAYSSPSFINWEYILAAGILTTALGYRTWQQPHNWGFYGLGFAVELFVASIIASYNHSLDWLAIASLTLGLTTQLAADWWVGISGSVYLGSWHIIPLLYAIFGLIFAHHTFNADTGLYTFAAALVGIGIGRRSVNFKLVSYLSLLGVSAAAYELLIYQLLQAKGGSPGDGYTLLAALAVAIAIFFRLTYPWLLPYLGLDATEVQTFAHLHWVAGSGLVLLALASSISTPGEPIWLAVTLVLAFYAIMQGRLRESWTYPGILELGIAIGYWLHLILPPAILLDWSAAIACGFALAMYSLPWNSWGWSITPWQTSAQILPVIIVTITAWNITIQSLLLVGAFYAWLAKAQSKVRLSYLSLLLANWAILRIFYDNFITEPFWYGLLWGGSLLYIAQVDPGLRSQSERDKRHLLRSLATGLICFTALYQAEIGIKGWSLLLLGFLIIGLGFAFILLGIILRVRAFLYIGTLTFIIRFLRQVWLFIDDYSLFLWATGIILGSILIWIALTFEARRSQAIAFVQYWLSELETWE